MIKEIMRLADVGYPYGINIFNYIDDCNICKELKDVNMNGICRKCRKCYKD